MFTPEQLQKRYETLCLSLGDIEVKLLMLHKQKEELMKKIDELRLDIQSSEVKDENKND